MNVNSMSRRIRSTHPYRVNTGAVKNLVNRFIKTDLVTDARFPPSVFDEVLRLCALHCSTISHVCDHITDPGYPSLDTVHRHLARLDIHSVVETINTQLSEIADHAKRVGFIPRKKRVDLAIDCTDLPYYGNPNTSGVVGGKPQRSTTWFFRFATICIVEEGYRLPLGVLPVDQFATSDLTGVVTELLKMASEHVFMRVVLMDRGFHSVKLFRKLKELGVSWLMPAKKTKRVSEAMAEMVESAEGREPGSRMIVVKGQDGEEEGVTLMVEWSRKKKKWLGYLSERRRSVKRYGKRWGIETKYRDVNRGRGWTTSKSWVVRVLLYGIGVMMNGVWELYRRMLRSGTREIVDRVGEMGEAGVRRRWAEKMGQLRVMVAILLGHRTCQGGEVM